MRFNLSTKGFNDVIDITEKVAEAVEGSGIEEGACLVSSAGSTCGLTSIEYEEGAVQDLKDALDRLAPQNKDYEHCKKWGDCNGYAHIRSALINPFLVLPIEEGKLALGAWQQIVFLDFDNRSREREIKVIMLKK